MVENRCLSFGNDFLGMLNMVGKVEAREIRQFQCEGVRQIT